MLNLEDMLNKELISTGFPTLGLNDTVNTAINLMKENEVSQMVVVTDEKYEGIVFEDDLLNLNEDSEIKDIPQYLSKVAVNDERHFLEAVQSSIEYNLSMIPVITAENEFSGIILKDELLGHLGRMIGAGLPGGIIELTMPIHNFSSAEIIKLVETNDAQITQLNTYWDTESGQLVVTIKVNKFEISDIVSTFQRYEYNVRYYFGEELYKNELKDNFDHLMNYLSI